MTPKVWMVPLAASAAAGVLFLLAASPAGNGEAQEVFVTNFPETQRVEGTIAVEGAIHQAALESLKDVEVPPVSPTEIRRLINAGTITTDGFGAMVLSLSGQSKGLIRRVGEVGAILVPDEEPVLRALDERGQVQFPFEVKVPSVSGDLYFFSRQPRFVVGFPRYRVLLYNTTDKTVSVNLYAYLTN